MVILSNNLITGDLRLFIECDFTQGTIKNVGKYYPTLVMNLDVVCYLPVACPVLVTALCCLLLNHRVAWYHCYYRYILSPF